MSTITTCDSPMAVQPPIYPQDPAAKLDYTIDWRPTAELDRQPFLNANEEIVSSSWSAPTGVNIVSDSHTGRYATVWLDQVQLSGDDPPYRITNTITTSEGRIQVQSFELVGHPT